MGAEVFGAGSCCLARRPRLRTLYIEPPSVIEGAVKFECLIDESLADCDDPTPLFRQASPGSGTSQALSTAP